MRVVSIRDSDAFSDAAYEKKTNKVLFGLSFAKNWVLERFAMVAPVPSWRAALHRWRGVNIGKDVYIGYDVIFDRVYPEMITIGDYAVIADRCIISAHGGGAVLLKRAYPREMGKVNIGRGAWLAPNCIVIKDVDIGELSVIGTGSVVTRSIPPKSVAVGVPAKVIRTMTDAEIGDASDPI